MLAIGSTYHRFAHVPALLAGALATLALWAARHAAARAPASTLVITGAATATASA